MIQIFIVGSSSVYGVGSSNGGWADLIKQEIHKKMYGNNGVGEKYEIYNFGKSGATIDFVLETFPDQFKQYGRGGKIITVFNVGGNNAKAEYEPDNFVSTLEEYSKEIAALLDLLKEKSDHVIGVGGGYYDEQKTNPKQNPLTGGRSFFTNERKQEFQNKQKELCDERNITFIDVGVKGDEWIQKYLYKDGLHPNQQGYKLIAKKILKELNKVL
jgi:lysophospholipase L1-like esterase